MVKSTLQRFGGHREFGRMGMVTNQVTFGLAPFEQKSFINVTKHVWNVLRRFRTKVLVSGPPLFIGYQTYLFCIRRNLEVSRKNPADFANDT